MNSQKLLLITKALHRSPCGGRELLCKQNFEILQSIFIEKLFLLELKSQKITPFFGFVKALFGYIDGIDEKSIEFASTLIISNGIKKVFIDGSNLGLFAYRLKRNFPELEIITFFHNVEVRFFWGAFLTHKNPRSIIIMLINYIAERMSVIYSDKILSLSERDSLILRKLYGRVASHILPISLEDKLPTSFSLDNTSQQKPYALFVGSDFYANKQGIRWFVKEVVPRIEIDIVVVGRGLESLKRELERHQRVTVVGSVKSLHAWYIQSEFVIAPIFDGSGMKTKVAEALMFGKRIIGTREAFSGYEDIAFKVGWVCQDADQFVDAIKFASKNNLIKFDEELRLIYLENYSIYSSKRRLKRILST